MDQIKEPLTKSERENRHELKMSELRQEKITGRAARRRKAQMERRNAKRREHA